MVIRRAARFDERARRSAWLVWLAGVGVYFLAVLHRASLGVAGPQAVDRLGISATELGAFIMVQLGIYAVMQVPAGIVLDRWGPRRVLLVATLVMGTAQILFAFATTYPIALLARALLGVGDSAVFVAVLRLAAVWFPRGRYAVLTMLTGLAGMAGNLAATVPLVLALGGLGWTTTFAITGATSLVYTLLLLRPAVAAPYRRSSTAAGDEPDGATDTQPDGATDTPPGNATDDEHGNATDDEHGAGPGEAEAATTGDPGPRDPGAEGAGSAQGPPSGPTRRRAWAQVRAAWSRPETRLGFWTHQATMTPGVVVSLVWGYPYLTEALGYSNEAAASQLSWYVVANLIASLFVGPIAGRRPTWRTAMAVAISAAGALAIAVLVLWPGGHPPGVVVTAVFAVLALGGPASQIGFHLARDYNPAARLSTATGLVNVGGFSGAMIVAISVGAVLDIASGGAPATLADFRWAMASISVLVGISTSALLVSLLGARAGVLRRMARGERVVVAITERWWDRAYRRLRKR